VGCNESIYAAQLWIAGRLYIAWCAAAIGLPVLAGALFDRTGSYASTVWVAAGINVLGMRRGQVACAVSRAESRRGSSQGLDPCEP